MFRLAGQNPSVEELVYIPKPGGREWKHPVLKPGMDGFSGPPTLEPIKPYNPSEDESEFIPLDLAHSHERVHKHRWNQWPDPGYKDDSTFIDLEYRPGWRERHPNGPKELEKLIPYNPKDDPGREIDYLAELRYPLSRPVPMPEYRHRPDPHFPNSRPVPIPEYQPPVDGRWGDAIPVPMPEYRVPGHGGYYPQVSDNTYWAGERLNIPKETLIAATPGEMRLILDKVTQRFKNGQLTVEQLRSALVEAAFIANPKGEGTHLKQMIDKAYENPLTSFLVSNPDAAQALAKKSLPMLQQFGVNTSGLSGVVDTAMPYLIQAKKDGLLDPNVTKQQLSTEISQPLQTALQDWAHDANNDPELDKALFGTIGGEPIRDWKTILFKLHQYRR